MAPAGHTHRTPASGKWAVAASCSCLGEGNHDGLVPAGACWCSSIFTQARPAQLLKC